MVEHHLSLRTVIRNNIEAQMAALNSKPIFPEDFASTPFFARQQLHLRTIRLPDALERWPVLSLDRKCTVGIETSDEHAEPEFAGREL
jgi:hypothetical protein